MLNDRSAVIITLFLITGVALSLVNSAVPSTSGNATSFVLSGGEDPPGGETPTACGTVDYAAKNAGKDGCANKTTCGAGSCCDYELAADGSLTGNCVCEENKNPCGTDEKKCLACMGYAEGGGTKINDDCMKYVMCTAKNRIGDKDFGNPKTACEAVAQGDGKQYNPYKCVCDNQSSNQKYCKCCSGTITNELEKKEAEKAREQAKNLDCSGFSANAFNNAGMDSWAKKNCKPVAPPTACPTFDFYVC
ncbi:MAG: hypothetical protein FJY86_01290 [Candidatus Diapherotrites archaeon]|uniref:Uncharacterized protein n=1 Tax=Candidatus Iainarchaeum sp. TaxID=3101447 RepID=A0A8T4C7N9_9ARCH|nr:hypothetical protein [Candidatus Diapherotrites archaeon]